MPETRTRRSATSFLFVYYFPKRARFTWLTRVREIRGSRRGFFDKCNAVFVEIGCVSFWRFFFYRYICVAFGLSCDEKGGVLLAIRGIRG